MNGHLLVEREERGLVVDAVGMGDGDPGPGWGLSSLLLWFAATRRGSGVGGCWRRRPDVPAEVGEECFAPKTG